MRHRLEYAAVAVVRAVVRILPDAAVRQLGALLGLAFYGLDRVHRRVAETNLATVDALRHMAEASGNSVAQLAIAWTLANPAVDLAIVGARRARHVEDSVAAAEVRLTQDDLARIDRIMAGAVPVVGPTPDAMPTR